MGFAKHAICTVNPATNIDNIGQSSFRNYVGASLGDAGPMLSRFGPTATEIARFGPKSRQNLPKPARLAELGPHAPDVSNVWPASDHI